MPDIKPIVIDDGLAEYFDFEVKKQTYRMRYPNVEETDLIRDNALDEHKTRTLLFEFIENVDPKGIPIQELHKTLPINAWTKLIKLILEKLSE